MAGPDGITATATAAADSPSPRFDSADASSTSPTVLASQLKLVTSHRSPMSPATREQLFGGLPFTKLMQQVQTGRGGSSGRLTSPDLKALNSLIHSRSCASLQNYSTYHAYSDYLDR